MLAPILGNQLESGRSSSRRPVPNGALSSANPTTSAKFLAYALDQHAIVSVADLHGNITFVNDKFVQISGYAREELIGQNHRLLKSDEHPPEFYRTLWRTIARGKTWSGEIKNLKKTGEPYWVKATMVPYLDGRGKPLEYLSIRTDITEIKSQEAFKQQQISFDLVRGEVYMFWPDTLKFFYLNKDARARFQRWNKDPSQLTVVEVMDDVPEVQLRHRLRRLETGQERIFTYYRDLVSRNGSMFPAEIIIQYVAPEGEAPRFVAVARDISATKQAEKAKAEFIATVRHELRTPLTSIKGALGLIKAGVTGGAPEKASKLIDIAINSSKRLETLIKDLLVFDELESGRLTCRLEDVDMSRIIEDAANEFSASPQSEGIRIITRGLDRPVPVIGDRARLMQVLSNLLSNAAKFSDKGEPVEIDLFTDEDRALITVKDHGIGIPPDAQETIFEAFSHADSSDVRRAGGIGIGLCLVKAVIHDHGGEIDLESEVGKGTTFAFSLRLSDADPD